MILEFAQLRAVIHAGMSRRMRLHLRLQLREETKVFVRQVHELFGHLLLEIKLWIQLLQRRVLPFEFLAALVALRALRRLARLMQTRQIDADAIQLIAQFWQHFQIPLPALDFLVENDAVETFAAFNQLVRQIEMCARDESEPV